MKKRLLLIPIVCGLIVSAQQASAEVVNIDSRSSTGYNELLGPGTYTVNIVGTAGGGLYDAWNPYAPDRAGEFTDRFAIGFGSLYTANFTQYEDANGVGYSTALAALTGYKAAFADGTLVQYVNDLGQEHGTTSADIYSYRADRSWIFREGQ